jgi:phosphoribosylformimino-5-aminoimidazole carboxamide ribotide isomerase
MKFRPCIDIHEGKVKQIVGGTLKDNSEGLVENFVTDKDVAYFAELYKRDGLIGGHIIMLGPGNEKEALKALRSYPNGLQVGGGINPVNAGYFLDQGASHVIVTSYVFKDGKINFNNLDKLIRVVGQERLVLDLSCREKNGTFLVVTDRWQNFTNFEVTPKNLDYLASYCDEFLVHGVDVEGQCNGVQTGLVQKLGLWASREDVKTPVTYAGGIRSVDDLKVIYNLGEGKLDFTVGSALDIFGGKYLSYREIVDWKLHRFLLNYINYSLVFNLLFLGI